MTFLAIFLIFFFTFYESKVSYYFNSSKKCVQLVLSIKLSFEHFHFESMQILFVGRSYCFKRNRKKSQHFLESNFCSCDLIVLPTKILQNLLKYDSFWLKF